MVAVRVLAAEQTPTGPRADVELDHRLVVKGVRITDSWADGRPLALAPLREDDPNRPLLVWGHEVGRQIARAVLRELGDGALEPGEEGEAA